RAVALDLAANQAHAHARMAAIRPLWTVTLGGEPVALVAAEHPQAAIRVAAHLAAIREQPGEGATLARWNLASLQARPPPPDEAQLWQQRAGGVAGDVQMAGFILGALER